MTTLHLPVDRSSGVPIHRQVYDGLRQAILDGRPGFGGSTERRLSDATKVLGEVLKEINVRHAEDA